MQRYIDDCNKNIIEWRDAAVIDYPKTLKVSVGNSTTYVAAVDIADDPRPADDVIPYGTPKQVDIAVQCHVTAELLPPPDDSLKVTDIGNTARSSRRTG